jgi:hypothetical protein
MYFSTSVHILEVTINDTIYMNTQVLRPLNLPNLVA